MRDLLIGIAVILIIAGVAFGLAQVRPDLPPTPSQPFVMTTGGETPLPDEKVVMRVNGEPVTEREFNAVIRQSPEQMHAYYASENGRRALADQLVKLKALEQEAQKLGAAGDPEVRTQLSLDRANILASYALRKSLGTPTDQELRAAYEKEKANLSAPSLSHILVAYAGGALPPRDGGQPLPADQAMAKARTIVARLRAGGDFTRMAEAQSDDPNSASNGGDLGPFSPEQLPPELAQAVMKLKPGEVSDPIRTRFGIHILRVTQSAPQPLERVKGALQEKIQQDKVNAMLARLQKSAKVELDPVFFAGSGKSPGAAPRNPS